MTLVLEQTMARVTARLLDENENFVRTVRVESDEAYTLNSHFESPDGGMYVVCDVRHSEPPTDTVLEAIWFDDPHPGCA